VNCTVLDETTTEQQCIDFFNNEMLKLLRFSVCADFQKICVAVSGGADSMCLLWLLHRWCVANHKELHCVTVDHKLRKESREEADFVHDFCKSLNVSHVILDWNHCEICDHGKLENLARKARYKLISEYCFKNEINYVCVAHNWDDQLETYKLREQYQSTAIGLACMSQVRTIHENLVLLRPVLYFTKNCLQFLLTTHCINWKNDSMNDDDTYQRVKFRKLLKNATIKEKEQLKSNITLFRNQRNIVEKQAVNFLKNHISFSQYGYAKILYDAFLKFNKDVQNEVLRRVIWCIGGKEYLPTISDYFIKNIFDKKTQTLWNCVIKHKKQYIMFFRENRNIPKIQWSNVDTKNDYLIFDNRFKIDLKLVDVLMKNHQHNDDEENRNTNFLFTINDVSLIDDLPYEVVQTLPQIATDSGNFILCSGIAFVKKVNLFDIFL